MKPHPVVLVYFAERLSSRMRIIPTDTLDEEDDGGGNSEASSTLLQACAPREPHPRQVDILLDKGSPVTCVKYNGRPQAHALTPQGILQPNTGNAGMS